MRVRRSTLDSVSLRARIVCNLTESFSSGFGGEIVPKWLLPTVSEVVTSSDPTWMIGDTAQATGAMEQQPSPFSWGEGGGRQPANQTPLADPRAIAAQKLRAEREWTGAIAALDTLLKHFLQKELTEAIVDLNGEAFQSGMVLSGPLPVLSQPDVVRQLATWTLATPTEQSPHWLGFRLLPADMATPVADVSHPLLPLLPGDPLTTERFCLVLTPWFSLVMVLGESATGAPTFMFSFAPDVVLSCWEALRPRILLMSSHQVDFLDELVLRFPPITPDFKTVMQFSRLMLQALPDPLEENNLGVGLDGLRAPDQPLTPASHVVAESRRSPTPRIITADWHPPDPVDTTPPPAAECSSFDVELVKAIAHEVRTPLTTIRTLTRSLLRRSDLPSDVLRRLGIIDRECSEQIDRFGLIFKAVELESAPSQQKAMSLIRTSLNEVFQQSIPRWQQHASQRQMRLTVRLPDKMPAVVSDPTVLDQALTSLIERFTRNLPAGSNIQLEVTPAGSQLKVQLQSQVEGESLPHHPFTVWKTSARAIGQMLMFQPETGSLSLNLAVTKNLFQAIGGKLIVKQRPQQGEVMTVYLPLEASQISPLDSSKIITV